MAELCILTEKLTIIEHKKLSTPYIKFLHPITPWNTTCRPDQLPLRNNQKLNYEKHKEPIVWVKINNEVLAIRKR